MTDSPETSPTRELAAIMFSDVVGFTAIMGRDEQKGVQAIADHRAQLRALLPKFNGRLIGEVGDGTLTSFHSVLEAIGCARELQANLRNDPELRLRIGIHLGDVLLTGNTVLGDGVNVASRIHALAAPGGICISEHVYDEIRNKPGMRAKDLGVKNLKNVSRPIRVYALQVPATPEASSASRLRSVAGRPALIVGTIFAIAIAIAFAFAYRARIVTAVRSRVPVSESAKATVAVLPFANLSGNKDDEYFSDGITDEITGDLSKIAGLQVIARTSSYAFKGQNEDVKKIAGLLHVRNVLDGSVQRTADRVRIEVELIDAANGFTIWSDRYDEKMADVFQIQSDVAESVAKKLKARLLPGVKERLQQRPTENLEAYDLYLRGLPYSSYQMTEEAGVKAIDYFSRATAKDPNFADAWARLAIAYAQLSDVSIAPREAVPKVRDYGERALAIDENNVNALATLAWAVHFQYDWDPAKAEREMRRAIDLEPNSDTSHWVYGMFLACMGRYDEAISEYDTAYRLNPLFPYYLSAIGDAYAASSQYDRALEYIHRAIAAAPDFWFSYFDLGVALAAKGDLAGAVAAEEKTVALANFPLTEAGLAGVYAVAGRRADAEKILDRLTELSRHRYVPALFMGTICMNLGDKEQAFRLLQKAYDDRSQYVTQFKQYPTVWDQWHSDPRFAAMARKAGVPY